MKKQSNKKQLNLDKFKIAKISKFGKSKIKGGGEGNGNNDDDDNRTTDTHNHSYYCNTDTI